MGKSPGFWFFTGDWRKDSELQFCSIFARGLLVDLLCILFEAKEQGYASKPDGTPRSNEEIVSAVAGSTLQEKLAALAELESSGVLSRDSRGVLYSRRLARLAELSNSRSKAGSKGGSKRQAKAKQNGKQTDKQNTGVTVSDSVSDSDTNNKAGGCLLEFPTEDGAYIPSKETMDTWKFQYPSIDLENVLLSAKVKLLAEAPKKYASVVGYLNTFLARESESVTTKKERKAKDEDRPEYRKFQPLRRPANAS